MADALNIILYLFFVAALVGFSIMSLGRIMGQYRGQFGRPYGDTIEDLLREDARRGELILALAEARRRRSDKL